MVEANLDKLYSKPYFGTRMDWKPPVYKTIANEIKSYFGVTEIVDVGCGNGVLLEHFDGLGLEGSIAGVNECKRKGLDVRKHDLRQPFPYNVRAELTVSIEVAEHIEPQWADNFVQTLTQFSDTIILTASDVPSAYHFNPQPKGYWIDKLEAKGWKLSHVEFVHRLSLVIPKEYDYLYRNMMIFEL